MAQRRYPTYERGGSRFGRKAAAFLAVAGLSAGGVAVTHPEYFSGGKSRMTTASPEVAYPEAAYPAPSDTLSRAATANAPAERIGPDGVPITVDVGTPPVPPTVPPPAPGTTIPAPLPTVPGFEVYGVSNFHTGATRTENTFKLGASDATAVAAGKAILEAANYYEAQHLMGWGASNPEPSPGVYNWTSLDKIFNSMSGADETVLTACCAPAWMKGTLYDFTNTDDKTDDKNYLEVAPLREHFEDYANLVVEAVKRYPQIKQINVWNEMKGFWNKEENRWDHEAYTDLYNLIWDKVKAIRPDIKIGGPYIVMDTYLNGSQWASEVSGSWGTIDKRVLANIKGWLEDMHGADLFLVDGSNGIKGTAQADWPINPNTGKQLTRFEALAKFDAVAKWLRSLPEAKYPGARTLPLQWAEYYNNTNSSNDSPEFKNAMMADGTIHAIKSGVQTAMYWGPEGTRNEEGATVGFPLPQFTSTKKVDVQAYGPGGQITLFGRTQMNVNNYFPPGTPLVKNGNLNDNIDTLSSPTQTMLVNKTNLQQTATIFGKAVVLTPYEVEFVPTS